MASPRVFVGLDVGGTTMKAAAVNDAGVPLSKPAVLETKPERGQDAGLDLGEGFPSGEKKAACRTAAAGAG